MTNALSRPTISVMNETTSKLNHLEEQVNELLVIATRLGDENSDLRNQLNHIKSERSSLLESKEQAKSQVEAMITRLRSMENA